MVLSGISGKHWVALSSFDFCSLLWMLFMVIRGCSMLFCASISFIRHLRHHHPGIKIDMIQIEKVLKMDK